MSVDFTLIAVISIIFGILIFLTDYYEKQHPKPNISLIAGISLAYFFLVLLPEITKRIPEFPLHLEFIEYSFILIGFVFAHLSEKFILQNVESKSQRRMRKLIEKERILELKKFAERFGAEPWVGMRFNNMVWFFLSLDNMERSKNGSFIISKDIAKKKGLEFDDLIKS